MIVRPVAEKKSENVHKRKMEIGNKKIIRLLAARKTFRLLAAWWFFRFMIIVRPFFGIYMMKVNYLFIFSKKYPIYSRIHGLFTYDFKRFAFYKKRTVRFHFLQCSYFSLELCETLITSSTKKTTKFPSEVALRKCWWSFFGKISPNFIEVGW